MYSKTVPFKDFNDKPKNATVHFNLTEREVMKNLVPLQTILEWRDSMKGDLRELDTQEVVDFYNNFEELLLNAWGEPSADGLHFRKAGRYDFEESALFNACMVEFITDTEETGRLLEGIMPKGMEDMVRKADANLEKAASDSTDEDMQKQIEELRAQLAAVEKKDKPETPELPA